MAHSWPSPYDGMTASTYVGGTGYISNYGYVDSSYNMYRIVGTTNNASIAAFDSSGTSTYYSDTIYTKTDFNFGLPFVGRAAGSCTITYKMQYKSSTYGSWYDLTALPSRNVSITINAKQNPTITSLPDWATDLTYTGGSLQVFTSAGTATGGTFRYGLGSSTSTEPTTWKSDYQDVEVQSAGEYFLWYKVVGNAGYNDLAPAYLHRVEVAKADQTFTFTTPISLAVEEIDSQSPSGNYQGTWSIFIADERIAGAQIVDNVLYITGLNAGSTRIDVTCSGNNNYNSRTFSIYVTVTADATVYFEGHWYKVKYSDAHGNLHNVTKIVKG